MKKPLFLLVILSVSSFIWGCEIETSVGTPKIVEEIAGDYGLASLEYYDGSNTGTQVYTGDAKSNVIITISKNTGLSEKNADVKIYTQSNGIRSILATFEMSISKSKTKYKGYESVDGVNYDLYLENNKLEILGTEDKIYVKYFANKL